MLTLALPLAAHGQDVEELPPPGPLPVVKEIEFRGNDTTQPRTMLREMAIKVGDPADPRVIEQSRQGVQDLGLFRSVVASEEAVDGGVRLVIKVKEKWYILPVPRADANSDGGYGYGAQLRWDNVWGLNHTFNPFFERRQPSEGDDDPEKRGVMTRGQLRYFAPFIFDSKYSASFNGGYAKTPYETPLEYQSVDTFFNATLLRKISEGRGSQGWTVSTGLAWTEEVNSGAQPAPARGHAVAASVGLYYRDLHFNVYSDKGIAWGFDVQSATDDIASDYDLTRYSVAASRYIPVGAEAAHRNLNFHFNAVARHDGSGEPFEDTYSIGGTETVRGFEPETAKGDAFYAARIEYLQPVFRRSIRALVVLDAANAFEEPSDAHLDKAYVSAGLGVRIRFQAFVAFEVEVGMAWPLNGGSPRLFATKV